jgi:serine/threonine-protein phosphatase 2A activator
MGLSLAHRMASSSFHAPRKAILTKEQLEAFQESETHATVVEYIKTLNESVVGVKLGDDCPASTVRWHLSVIYV